MLDYHITKKAKEIEKKKILAENIIHSFDTLDFYKKLNIDNDKLKKDVKRYFQKIEWL
jgi:hypothetical protein